MSGWVLGVWVMVLSKLLLHSHLALVWAIASARCGAGQVGGAETGADSTGVGTACARLGDGLKGGFAACQHSWRGCVIFHGQLVGRTHPGVANCCKPPSHAGAVRHQRAAAVNPCKAP